jgi:hypothetical protein
MVSVMVFRDELVAAVARRSGLTQAKSTEIVQAVLDGIREQARAGPVELSSDTQGHTWLVAAAGGTPAEDRMIAASIRDVVRLVPEIVASRKAKITESRIATLVDVLLGDDPAAEAMRTLEADNARARARFIRTVPTLTSKDLAAMAGHSARNASVTGSRWKQQGKVFSLPWRGGELYPAFQFRDGLPHPSVRAVLSELPKRMSAWQTAFWFTSANGWLEGRMPADCLDDKSAVVGAAEREAEPLLG